MRITNHQLDTLLINRKSDMVKKLTGKEIILPGQRLFLWNNGMLVQCYQNAKRFSYQYIDNQKKKKQVAIGTFSPSGDGIATFTIEQALNVYHTAIGNLKNQGIDPQEEKKKRQKQIEQERKRDMVTFGSFSEEWIQNKKYGSKDYQAKVKQRFEKYCDSIKNKPLHRIMEEDLRYILTNLAESSPDKKDSAHRLYLSLSDIFKQARLNKLIDNNPMKDILPEEFPAVKNGKFNNVTKLSDLQRVLIALDHCKGEPATVSALRLMPHFFLRASELLSIKWEDVDFKNRIIKLHKAKVLGRSIKDSSTEDLPYDYYLPLSDYAVEQLTKLKVFTGNSVYVFSNNGKALDHSTLLKALRKCLAEYKIPNATCIHGFRYTARSLLVAKLNIPPRVVEQQMSHSYNVSGEERAVSGDKYGYDNYTYIPERRALMDVYSLFLLGLRDKYVELTPEEARALMIEGKKTEWQQYLEMLQKKYVELSRVYEQVDG